MKMGTLLLEWPFSTLAFLKQERASTKFEVLGNRQQRSRDEYIRQQQAL